MQYIQYTVILLLKMSVSAKYLKGTLLFRLFVGILQGSLDFNIQKKFCRIE